jgi:hypothetical protein
MRVQFQRNFGTIGARGQWADLAPDEAALLIAHGIARSDSGLTDRAILDRAGDWNSARKNCLKAIELQARNSTEWFLQTVISRRSR